MKPQDKIIRTLPTLAKLFCSLALMFCSAGCWTDQSGTHHTLIIGLGVVSVNQTNPAAATVTSMHTLGMVANQNGLTAGYSANFITSVPDGAEDVRIEASQHLFAPIKIEVQKTQLTKTNQINQRHE